MYLSRIKLNTTLRKTQLAMASPNIFHGAIEDAFESKQERNLWRLDRLKGDYYLLVLSASEPDIKGIIDQFGYVGDVGEVKSYEPLLDRISNDQTWRFRIVANPTHSIKNAKGRGKVVAHSSVKYQREWLEKKAVQNGFELREVNIASSEWKIFKKRDNNSRVRLKQTTYEGILTVKDTEAFKTALVTGIGRGKVYGMGLLTIVRV